MGLDDLLQFLDNLLGLLDVGIILGIGSLNSVHKGSIELIKVYCPITVLIKLLKDKFDFLILKSGGNYS